MSIATVQFLVGRLERADRKWDLAMARDGYRDDPDEADELGEPFTEEEWSLYGWADSWRLMVHRIENALDATPEAASLRANQYSLTASEPTYAESEQSLEQLSKGTMSTKAPKPKVVRRPIKVTERP